MPRAMLTWTQPTGGTGMVDFHALSIQATTFTHPVSLRAVGLVLLPGTAARLLGMSTGALVDASLPWAEIAGPAEAARLDDQLHRSANDHAKLVALQSSVLCTLARGAERMQRARAEQLDRLCAVVSRDGARAAAELALGERQLERRCRAMFGLAPKPKQLQRMARMHGLLPDALRRQRPPDADATLAAGFYDQSHLARDARRLTGATFRELLQAAHPDGAWWPLATQRLTARRMVYVTAAKGRRATTGTAATRPTGPGRTSAESPTSAEARRSNPSQRRWKTPLRRCTRRG